MKLNFISAILCISLFALETKAQITERERPKAWDSLAFGGRFLDRFLPIPVIGPLTEDTWGAENVIPRYVENGIEDNEWSYWGGNVLLGDDGRYHLFVCRWPENSPKGHMEWPNSTVVHAVSDHRLGPYQVKAEIGKGHNPEAFRLKDGRYVIYVINGFYIADDLDGHWEHNQFEFDRRDRPIIEGLSNLTFARREDGSYLMVCRGGGIWFSQTGVSPYSQVTSKSVYPPVEGRFEDPVVWRTNIQYHMIVNDWLGRIAYYLRSKDGIHWKVDPGEAYLPGIARYGDGTVVDWFKYERIKVLQDHLGRAVQANFAVIDVLKKEDRSNDNHSSKNISIPLTVGRQIMILDRGKINEETESIQVKIKAEEGFDPHVDMDINSLRFGASEEVNFGRGSKVKATKKSGDDLVVTFHGEGNGLTHDNFAAKLLGRTSDGKLLFGYARLPWVDYMEPALSSRLPGFTNNEQGSFVEVEVQNFGQVASKPAAVTIEQIIDGETVEVASGEVPSLNPFQKTKVEMRTGHFLKPGSEEEVKVNIFPAASPEPDEVSQAAHDVIAREIGSTGASIFVFRHMESDTTDFFSIKVEDNKVHVTGSSPTALCRGAYHYLRNATHSIVSWSGNRINIPETLPQYSRTVQSPFRYRYYMNTVTHGYTTPYWGWNRWEKEIDWMALHGMNMPLIGGAHEAILFRVFEKLGLKEEEILDYFSGPAHFPWNRMGNIGGWDGPPPESFFDKQVELTHKMLERMYDLKMHPIVHAFAGFVPRAISRLYPDEEVRELGWGGFDEKVHILAPESRLFTRIGKLYIEEWETEFGKGEFYLADSFNEMDVPLSEDPEIAKKELAAYGEVVYKPIKEANPDAVWVMQGWTFPYHRDANGELFWTPERLKAMMSRIPDDKLLLLDMANEYNALFWKIDYSWQMYEGFFGKQWIYSFIPNMGGKVPLNGVLDFYATAPKQALTYKNKGNLVGFGFAPEGIENNEVIYELLSDWGWRSEVIDPDEWLEMYCMARYGGYPRQMKEAWELLRESAYGTFTDHPRFKYQFRPTVKHGGSVHRSPEFNEAVHLFLACSGQLKESKLYVYDAIELGTQYLGLKVDDLLMKGQKAQGDERFGYYQEAISLMKTIDRLLASHPNHRLEKWVNLTRNFGDTPEEKRYYESNAKRLNTTWGGGVNEYAARTWSGLIGSYYLPRWELWLKSQKTGEPFDLLKWEESWIQSEYENEVQPFENPLREFKKWIR